MEHLSSLANRIENIQKQNQPDPTHQLTKRVEQMQNSQVKKKINWEFLSCLYFRFSYLF